MTFGSNGLTTFPSGADHVADDLRLVQGPAVGQGGVRIDQLERRHDVVALADPRLVRLARVDRRSPKVSCFHSFVGTIPATSPGRSIPVR